MIFFEESQVVIIENEVLKIKENIKDLESKLSGSVNVKSQSFDIKSQIGFWNERLNIREKDLIVLNKALMGHLTVEDTLYIEQRNEYLLERKKMIDEGLNIFDKRNLGAHGSYMAILLSDKVDCENDLDLFSGISSLSLEKASDELGIFEFYDGMSLMNIYAIKKAEKETEDIPSSEWNEAYEESEKKYKRFALSVYFGALYDATIELT